ncbi:peptide ABC transporter substrate-binding protein [Chlamydia crocodili]
MRDDPRSLDPRQVRLLSDMNLTRHIYEGLIQENTSTGHSEPALAESFSLSNDGKTYTFNLRQAHWSNGDPITSEDFIASWKQVISNEILSVYSFAFNPIKNVEKIQKGLTSLDSVGFYAKNDKTLVIELESPTSHFLKLLALPVFFPIHKNQRQSPSMIPIASSAFYPKQIKEKQWLKLEKNPYYYNQEQVDIETITIHFIADPNTASLLFNQGKIDWQGPPWGDRIPIETLSYLQTQGSLCSFDVAGTSWLIFNVNKSPLNHPKLREALSLALDKEKFVSTVFLGRKRCVEHILPDNLHTYPDTNNSTLEERNRKAKRLFRESLEELNISAKDLDGLPLILTPISSANALFAQMIREQWKDILGFTISITIKEFALLQSDLFSGDFSLAICCWYADFFDPMAFLTIFDRPTGIQPYMLDREDFTLLITTIHKETDLEKRKQLVSQAALYLENLRIVEPLYYDIFYFTLNENISNISYFPTGNVDFRYAKVS